MPISLLNWNILGPATRDVEEYGFVKNDYNRLEKHLTIIKDFDPDVICLQEVDHKALYIFTKYLDTEYQEVGYHKKGAHGGVVLYAKRSKFKVHQVITSGLKNSFKRSVGAFVGALLEDNRTNHFIFMTSVHLSKSSDHQALEDGIQQVMDLCAKLDMVSTNKIVFSGDFNTLYSDMNNFLVPVIIKKLHQDMRLFKHEFCVSELLDDYVTSLDHIVYGGLEMYSETSCKASAKYQHFDPEELEGIHDKKHIAQKLPSDHVPLFVVFK